MASTAAERLVDAITKSGPGTIASGAKLSTRDVWEVLGELYALRWSRAELQEAYNEMKEQHDGCM